VFGTKGGLTGVIADVLDRRTIGRALRARHTWATTGEHSVALATCAGFMQGDELEHRGAAVVSYRFLGDAGSDEIAAYDHSGCFWRRNLQEEAGYSTRRLRFRGGALGFATGIAGPRGRAPSPSRTLSSTQPRRAGSSTAKRRVGARARRGSASAPTPTAMPTPSRSSSAAWPTAGFGSRAPSTATSRSAIR
jgi:hypothetical protein